MATSILNIQGMTCGGCVKSVTAALQREEGVSQVEVNLADGTARVDFDPNVTTPQALAELVNDIGFEASCAA